MATKFKSIKLQLGYENGLYGGRADTNPGWLAETKNVSYHEGFIAKEPGESKYNATPLSGTPKILSGVEFSHDQINPRIIVYTSDGKLYKDSGAGTFPTVLASSLTVSRPAVFVEGGKEGAALNRKLFIFTGSNQVKVLSGDGNTVTNLSAPPLDWASSYPTSGFVFEGRLCGFGNANDPHRLYFSTTTNHEDFVGAGSFNLSIFPGEGLSLSAAVPVNRGVVLFKYPRGVYFLDTTNPVTSNWRVFKLSSVLGCPSQRCVVSHGGGILFLDSSGLPYLLTLGEAEGATFTPLFNNQNRLDELILNKLDVSTILTDWQLYVDKRFFGGEVNITDGRKRITLDFANGKPRARMTDRFKVVCAFETFLATSKRSGVMMGDDAGTVWKGEVAKYDRNGATYLFYFKTTSTDIDDSVSGKRKLGGELEIRYVTSSVTPTFRARVFFDNELSTSKLVSRTLSSVYYYDSGVTYDSGATYSETEFQVVSDIIKVFGSGKRIAVDILEESNKFFGIVDVIFYLELGDERVPS